MATLQDIADAVGVSKVTVSKVLRGKVKGSWPKSAARVEQIKRVAAEMDYQADWRAKALQSKRTNVIGLLSTDRPQTDTHDPRLLSGLVERFGAAGFHVLFYRVPAGGGRGGAGAYNDARFDGVIIDYHIEPEEIALIERSGLPATIVNAPSIGGIASVMPDHEAAGRDAARHLIELGHRRIAYLQSPAFERRDWPQHMFRQWRRGIRAEMKDAGLAGGYRDVSFEEQDLYATEDGAVRVLGRLLESPGRPTAVIANAAERAVENVLLPLEALGLSCPRDLSVVAMSDQRPLLWTRPQMTGVSIPYHELGRRAADTLLRLIDAAPDKPPPVAAEPLVATLVRRGSTAPPPPQT